MPDDYITTTTKRIVAIAAQGTATAQVVRPGNFITKLTGVRWPEPTNRNSRNFAELDITVPSQRIVSRNAARSFINSLGPNGIIIVWKQCLFLITLAFRGVDRAIPNAVAAEFESLLLADPQLGLATPVIVESGVGMDITTREETSQRTGNALGLVTEIRFPVLFELQRPDLTTPT